MSLEGQIRALVATAGCLLAKLGPNNPVYHSLGSCARPVETFRSYINPLNCIISESRVVQTEDEEGGAGSLCLYPSLSRSRYVGYIVKLRFIQPGESQGPVYNIKKYYCLFSLKAS